MYYHKKIINNQQGAAAVEFALVLPLLMLFIFGIIEFSLLLYNQQVITNAVREGARRGIIMRPATTRDVVAENVEIIARIHEFADSYLITFGGGVLSPVPLSNSRSLSFGTDLVVEANFLYNFLFLSTIGIGPITLNSVSTMRME